MMSKLESIWELPIINNKPLCKDSLNIRRALHKLKYDGKIQEKNCEDVIKIEELFLALYDTVNQYEKRRGNTNAVK